VVTLAGCNASGVTISATVDFGGTLSDSADLALSRLDRLELAFTGYPNTDANAATELTALGRIACTNKFHHATARVRAYLDDDAAGAYDVTGHSSLSSSAPAVVAPSGSRLRALSAGEATVTASFAASSSAAAPLPVSAGAVPVESVGLSVRVNP